METKPLVDAGELNSLKTTVTKTDNPTERNKSKDIGKRLKR